MTTQSNPVPADEATMTVEAPLTLNADNIIKRVEGNGREAVFDVIQDEKLLFSTVSAPLAHAFVAGYNAKPVKAVKDGDKAKPGGKGESKGADKPTADNAEGDARQETDSPTRFDPCSVAASRKRHFL